MELDLTRLSKLSHRDFAEKKQPPETPPEPLLEGGQYKNTPKAETPAEGLTGGLAKLQREADLKSIYGAGLGEPAPLRLELTETETRLQRLREAQQRETEPDSLKRIERAIKAHESRVAHLKAQITKAEEKPA